MQPKRTPLERVLARTVCDLPTRCWLCTARPKRGGYVQLIVDGHSAYAHRITYEAFVGPIRPGLELHHRCKTPGCCAPDHLEVVNDTEHGLLHRKTHCVHGHELTPENTLVNTWRGGGGRHCRACRLEIQRRSYARHRPPPTGLHRGERASWSKLTEDGVRAIRRRAGTETLTAIARSLNVGLVTVFDVVHGKSWTHVT